MMILFGSGASSEEVFDLSQTPTSLVMGVSYEGIARGLFTILVNFNWFHVTILYDINAPSIYYKLLGPTMMLLGRQQYTNFFVETYTFNTKERHSLTDALVLAKSRSRGKFGAR